MTALDPAPDAPLDDEDAAGPDAARRLFRYITVEEWRDHRAVMGVFAGTFFSEFTPDDVVARLDAAGYVIDPAVVADRLERLRRWGNLTVSSAVGNPTSLVDYYRRRNRYLITRAGQEVHEVVEGVLSRVDEVRDVSTGRLRALLAGLRALCDTDVAHEDPVRLADLVRAIFDPHEAFTSEITQFFAAINHWQSRYDLTPDEFSFFAEVLVGYVAERLDEIERTSLPIGRLLEDLSPQVPAIVARAGGGLASRVDQAGLAAAVNVSRAPGSSIDDWEHLAGWFVRSAGGSRIERLTADAVSAIRTLTMNLTRLSRVGIGASSRRSDLLRLARMFLGAGGAGAPKLAAAAFGLNPTNHWGVLSTDAGDPVGPGTPWAEAPRAEVPVSLRERGDTTNRGSATPMRDRSREQAIVRQRRELARTAARRVDAELLAADAVDGRELSSAALSRLQDLVARTLHAMPLTATRHSRADGEIVCTVERAPGHKSAVSSPQGTWTLYDLRIQVRAGDVG
ncbi:MAG: TIGR02677 family protein [Acidimicrobiales bacterium]